MASNTFQNYSFSNSLKTMVDPFAQLLKKPAATSTSPALFTPVSPKPVAPELNPAPNVSILAEPKYVPPQTPTIPTQLTQAGNIPSAIVARPGTPSGPISAQSVAPRPVVPQITPPTAPTAPTTAPGAAFAPAVPQISPEAIKALDLAEKAYAASQQISPEELSTQEDIDKIIAEAERAKQSGRLGMQATSEQPIAMEFITGQQRAIENRLTNTLLGLQGKAEPLERKLARMQAVRQASIEGSKFALDRADKAVAAERSRIQTSKEEAESARRFGITTGLQEKSLAQSKAEADRKFEEDKRQFGLDYANKQREIAVKEAATSSGAGTANTTDRIALVKSSLQKAKNLAHASGRSGLRKTAEGLLIGSTDYTNLVAETNTLRTNVLTMMTDPNIKKFFGPQMSNADVQLMTSAGTTLNPELQSPESMKSELVRLEDLITRMENAVTTGGGSSAGASYSGVVPTNDPLGLFK